MKKVLIFFLGIVVIVALTMLMSVDAVDEVSSKVANTDTKTVPLFK